MEDLQKLLFEEPISQDFVDQLIEEDIVRFDQLILDIIYALAINKPNFTELSIRRVYENTPVEDKPVIKFPVYGPAILEAKSKGYIYDSAVMNTDPETGELYVVFQSQLYGQQGDLFDNAIV